jgi:hypothetical protein
LFDVSQELADRPNADENLLKNISTGDETWVYRYYVETKTQPAQWISKNYPDPKGTASSVKSESETDFVF